MSSGVRKAFVLGAGLGTRLRPLTTARPKPLVPIFHKPLITFAFDHLKAHGVESFVVNTHHCPEAYDRMVGNSYEGCPVLYRHEPMLLETGGGIKNVEDLLGGEAFIVYNGDVLSDIPLDRLLAEHSARGNLATLALRSSGSPRHIQCDPSTNRVTDIRGRIGGSGNPSFLFTGITVLSPEIFSHIPAGTPVSIIPIYLELIRQGARIGGVVVEEGHWLDLGSRKAYIEAHQMFAPGGQKLTTSPPSWPRLVHDSATVHPSASLIGACAIGPMATVAEGAVLEDSVLWDKASAAPGVRLLRCVVRDSIQATISAKSYDF